MSVDPTLHWKDRVRLSTSGGLYLLMKAICGRPAYHYHGEDFVAHYSPGFGPSCVIAENGLVIANFIDYRGRAHVGQSLGTTIRFRDMMRRLADRIECSDAERRQMFDEVTKWVAIDWRAIGDRDDPLNLAANVGETMSLTTHH